LLAALEQALAPVGLILRGGFRPAAEDAAPEGTGTLLLIGNAGPAFWQAFEQQRTAGENPLDRWTAATIDPLAERFGASALYPFDGPPYWPFQRWAMRAEPVRPSPLGILIHPRFGLWHAYRAALAFPADDIPLPPREDAPDLCGGCMTKPCLTTCPIGAFEGAGYDVRGCLAHLRAAAGAECMTAGCVARLACPVGQQHPYPPAQAVFYMAAFRARS
jgi:ferredoxin